jgi:hypothetical protein
MRFSEIFMKLTKMIRRHKSLGQIEVAELEEIQEDLTLLNRLHNTDVDIAKRHSSESNVPVIGQINELDRVKWKKKKG